MRRTAPAIKSASNPQFSFVASGRCCCTARIFIPIGTTEKQYVSFNDDFTDWQYASGVIIPKQRGLMIKDITVYCAYDYNANDAYFTNISLVLEPAETYSYDSKGNPIAATDGNAKTASEFFADSPAPQELHHAQRRRRAKDTDWTQVLFKIFNIRTGTADILSG